MTVCVRWAQLAGLAVVTALAATTAAAADVRFRVDFRQDPPAEVIAEVRIHGNHVTPDAEILRLSGVTLGAPFEATTIADATTRLRADGRFLDVDVLKRYASIADLSQIVVVIVVNEGPVRIDLPDVPGAEPRVIRRAGFRNLMWLPIVYGEDGYGLTYGARLAWVGAGGERSRISVPLTWGGQKRAGIEFDRSFRTGPVGRVLVGAALERRTNPAFEVHDDRRRAWARVERTAGPVRLGAGVAREGVTFDGTDDDLTSVGADVAVDTRLNPVLPRNALFARAAWSRAAVGSTGVVRRTRYDGRAYVGLVGQSILVARAVREDASRPVPPYLRSLLGGWSSVRGFRAGSWTGDTLVAGSIELVLPLTSPVPAAQAGLSAFVDTGAAYDKGQRVTKQRFRTGIGGSAWITVPGFRLSLAVAHGRHAGTRAHFGIGIEY